MAPKTVLITGCGPDSIGSAFAQRFHLRGHRVFATSRTDEETSLDPALADLGIETFALDVTSDSSITNAVAKVEELTNNGPGPSLDILINCAGIVQAMPFADTQLADMKKLMDINVTGTWAVSQAFLPLLLESPHGGVLVGMASINEILCPPFFSAYNASKAAVEAMMRTIRRELAPLGVRVVMLKSGSVRSGLFRNALASSGLPDGSLYHPAVDKYIREREFAKNVPFMEVDDYAEQAVSEILKESPRAAAWFGGLVWICWILSWLGWETMLVSSQAFMIDEFRPDTEMIGLVYDGGSKWFEQDSLHSTELKGDLHRTWLSAMPATSAF